MQAEELKKVDNWQDINWKRAYNRLGEIQKDIVEATTKKNTKEIYRLQRKLVTTFDATALAVRKVVTNEGKKTPGIDKEIWDTPEKRFEAILKICRIVKNIKYYKASLVKRVEIPKKDGRTRTLGIPTMTDRAIQALYTFAIDPVIECKSDQNSYGFRKNRSCADAITMIRSYMDKDYSPLWILEADIAKCFDNIDHGFLMENTPICDKTALNQWLKAGIKIGGEEKGTPQGGLISPLLCNITLNGLEDEIKTVIKDEKWNEAKYGRPKINVIRYADDLIITSATENLLEKARIRLEEFLKVRGLEVKEEKTSIVNVNQGFNFLGFHIERKQKDATRNKKNRNIETLLIIEPSKEEVKNLKLKIKGIIKNNRSIDKILNDLNPLLRGWAEYFRITAHSRNIFRALDKFVWDRMWKWARTKHVGKTAEEIQAKYIYKKGNRSWIWGNNEREELFSIGKTSTIMVRPLKQGLNPYLPENREYFEKRKEQRLLTKYKTIIHKKYNYKCQICGQSLYNGETIHLDHIKPRKEGGTYDIENIRPVHEMCHWKITHKPEKSREIT